MNQFEDMARLVRRLLYTNAALIIMLCLSGAMNFWMGQQVRYFGNKAVEANEAHEKTLRDQAAYLEELRERLKGPQP